MHVRLILEFACVRLPATIRHRSRLRRGMAVAALLLLGLLPLGKAQALGPVPIAQPDHALDAAALDSFWIGLGLGFAARGTVWSDFTERRYFPFHSKAVELRGEVRIDPARGLSLHYTTPSDVTVIVDQDGVLMRGNGRTSAPPADPRAAGANAAMLDVLRLNFADLEKNYAVYGTHSGSDWELELVARGPASAWTIGTLFVLGTGTTVNRIDLRHSEKQRIEITMDHLRPGGPFGPAVLTRYFR